MGDQIGDGGILSSTLCKWRMAAGRPYLSGKVLDFGCGRGNLASFFEPAQYFGVDSDEESLEIARSLHPAHRFVLTIPPEMMFDSIAMFAVLEHIENPVQVLSKFTSILANGGLIVITTPHPNGNGIHHIGAQLGLFSQEAHDQHKTLIDCDTMRELASHAGLKILRHWTFMCGLNQLFVLSRL